jgi:hypothetical protein
MEKFKAFLLFICHFSYSRPPGQGQSSSSAGGQHYSQQGRSYGGGGQNSYNSGPSSASQDRRGDRYDRDQQRGNEQGGRRQHQQGYFTSDYTSGSGNRR